MLVTSSWFSDPAINQHPEPGPIPNSDDSQTGFLEEADPIHLTPEEGVGLSVGVGVKPYKESSTHQLRTKN
jgi:hypothetical protein